MRYMDVDKETMLEVARLADAANVGRAARHPGCNVFAFDGSTPRCAGRSDEAKALLARLSSLSRDSLASVQGMYLYGRRLHPGQRGSWRAFRDSVANSGRDLKRADVYLLAKTDLADSLRAGMAALGV